MCESKVSHSCLTGRRDPIPNNQVSMYQKILNAGQQRCSGCGMISKKKIKIVCGWRGYGIMSSLSLGPRHNFSLIPLEFANTMLQREMVENWFAEFRWTSCTGWICARGQACAFDEGSTRRWAGTRYLLVGV